MTYVSPPAAGLAAGSQKAPVRLDRAPQNGTAGGEGHIAPPTLPGTPDPAHAGGRPAARQPLMRRIKILYMPQGETDPNSVVDVTRLVPSLAAFDEAFTAFARGTLFQTERGPVAVEDLWPGDGLRTVDAGFLPLLWRGSTLIVPRVAGQMRAMGTLTRIAADALG
ncbi:MAG: Hint domain-containing protein, partial [Rubellimicrobium sp.]|nr:Hint domain-containing protein [Rubellimicrobium sp.]